MCARGRVVAEPRLSPDGDRVAFVSSRAARGELVIVSTTGGPELVVTADPPVRASAAYGGGAFDWVPDGGAVVYAAPDKAIHLVASDGGPPRPVVAAGTAAATCPAVAPDGSRVAYLLDAHHVAVAPLAEDAPWPVRVSAGADFCFDPAWSPDGRTVVWHEWDVPRMPWDGSRIALAPADGSAAPKVVAGGDDVQVQQPRFSPDGSSLAYLSDATGWLNLWVANGDGSDARPVLEEACEHGEPAWGPGQRSYAWSPDSRRIALCRNDRGFGVLCVVDAATGRSRELSRGAHGGLSWVGGTIVAVRSGARTPTELVAFEVDDADSDTRTDAHTGADTDGARPPRRRLARGPVGGFDAAGLTEPERVSWPAPAVDGVSGPGLDEVHGRLYRPERPRLDPPPLIVWIHGGPTSQWAVSFYARLAYFLDRGWAVLLPDHRGSTGWGRAYAQALQSQWGVLDVEDTAAGMRAAAERGWCDGRRMVPMGGSAGGFTVLLLLARCPELCAAGVDLFGVADLFDLDETTHRFEAHYLHGIVGPLPDAADRYRDRSPINLAELITAPLLILQGKDDEVVPPAQSEVIADRLRALGRTVELHLYDGEGHGWQRPETTEDELARVEGFLDRHVLRRRGA